MTFSQFSEIEFRFDTAYRDYVKKKYNSFAITDFKENYNIEIEEGVSFWFGFFHNSEKNNLSEFATYNFTIEFNPNKLKDNKIVKYILSCSKKWLLRSLDMAIDIPISILDLTGFDKGRYKDIRIFSKGYDDKTIYIGRSDNRTKIYNKKIESNLDIFGNLTRVEVSSKFDFPITRVTDLYSFVYDIALPQVYTNEYMYSFKDYEDKTLLAVLYAVQSGFNLSDLTRRYKEKVENLLNGGNLLPFDKKICTKVVFDVLEYYLQDCFMNDIQKRVKYGI
jgi:hypothetical protein